MAATNSERVRAILEKLNGKLGNGEKFPALATTAFTKRRGKVFLVVEGHADVEVNASMPVKDIRTAERLLNFLGC